MRSKCTIIFVNFKIGAATDFIYMSDYKSDVSMKDVELEHPYKYYRSTIDSVECPF